MSYFLLNRLNYVLVISGISLSYVKIAILRPLCISVCTRVAFMDDYGVTFFLHPKFILTTVIKC